MKAVSALILLSALSVAASALAQGAPAPKSASATDDLPLTPRFSALLSGYRDCVLQEVDKTALGSQQAMANAAMQACALARGEVEAQLLADVRAQNPSQAHKVAYRAAQDGMAQIDPMIEATAVDWAHVRYARSMY